MSESRPRIVVLGGGFAGVGAAHELKKADVNLEAAAGLAASTWCIAPRLT